MKPDKPSDPELEEAMQAIKVVITKLIQRERANTEAQRQLANMAAKATKEDGRSAVPAPFINYEELARRVPLCERTLRTAIRNEKIPSVQLPGGRRRMFHWESVERALLRLQGGERYEV